MSDEWQVTSDEPTNSCLGTENGELMNTTIIMFTTNTTNTTMRGKLGAITTITTISRGKWQVAS
jgi:hypothetical protein